MAAVMIAVGCRHDREEIVSSYPDGSPQLVYTMQGEGDKAIVTGEKAYYENGKTRWEKHFNGGKRNGTWHYYYATGKPFCHVAFDEKHQQGHDWQFLKADGTDYRPEKQCDSISVEELTEDNGLPLGAAYHYGNKSDTYLFYEDFGLRYAGHTLDGKPDGHCTFYHPNGQPQTEAIYSGGALNGLYTVYRDNGVPYYRGAYINNKRAGKWEFYDENGAPAYCKDFD